MSNWTNESVSPRRRRLPKNWTQIRRRVLTRDGYMCVMCGAPATHVDHIVPMLDDNRIEALQSLCAPHHRQKTSAEGGRARQASRPKRQRPQERHPGAL